MFGVTEWLGRFSQLVSLPGQIEKLGDRVMSKLNELTGQLQAVNERLLKAKGEIIDRINALEEALGDVDLPDEAGEALSALMATAQVLDDLNPDPEPAPVADPAEPAPAEPAPAESTPAESTPLA